MPPQWDTRLFTPTTPAELDHLGAMLTAASLGSAEIRPNGYAANLSQLRVGHQASPSLYDDR